MAQVDGASEPRAGEPWPVEIRVEAAGRRLDVAFDDGARFQLAAELLRVMSPSAEVQGHSRRERKTVGGKREVAIIGVDPIGSYAVRLSFDDLHSTGLYSWAYLHELGREQADRWAGYLRELEERGLSRDRPGEAVGSGA